MTDVQFFPTKAVNMSYKDTVFFFFLNAVKYVAKFAKIRIFLLIQSFDISKFLHAPLDSVY